MALESSSGISLGGGGHLVITPPDPLEVQMKLAQLAALRAGPQNEAERTAIARQDSARQMQALMEQSALGRNQLAEETRFHTGTLEEQKQNRLANIQDAQQRLAEETRYHAGTLAGGEAERAETARYHTGELAERASESAASQKTELAKSVMSNIGSMEERGLVPKGSTASVLKEQGLPEIERGIGTATDKIVKGLVEERLPKYKGYNPAQAETALSEESDPAVRAGLRTALGTLALTTPTAAAPTGVNRLLTAGGTGAPGIDLGGAAGRAFKYAPIGAANTGVAAANYLALPFTNTIASAMGMRPIQKIEPLPEDYGALYKRLKKSKLQF